MTKRDFRQLLRQAGYKATPAKIAVLNILAAAPRPLGVEEVIHKIHQGKFDQATIYRTINNLVAAGVVRRIDFQRGYALFELQDETDHHHVVCIECHRVADVQQCCSQSMNAIALQQSGFAEIKQHSLEFFGLCQSCKS